MNALYQMVRRYATQFLATHKTALDWIDTVQRDHPDVQVIRFNMEDKQQRSVPLDRRPSQADIIAPYDVLDRLGQVTPAEASGVRPAASVNRRRPAPAGPVQGSAQAAPQAQQTDVTGSGNPRAKKAARSEFLAGIRQGQAAGQGKRGRGNKAGAARTLRGAFL